jgi:hypothetical protein
MAQNVYYRVLQTVGDSLVWADVEHTLVTNWDEGDEPMVSCWEGQLALTPKPGSGSS